MAMCNLVLDMTNVTRRMRAAKPLIYIFVFANEFGLMQKETADNLLSAIVGWAAKAAIVKTVKI